jgi:hypothetical protein
MMNTLKHIQAISLATALGLPEVEKPLKTKTQKVKKVITGNLKKGFRTGVFLGIPFMVTPSGETMSTVLNQPLEKPKNIQQCYRCDKTSEQPHYQGKVQYLVWVKKKQMTVPVPPNCPHCHSLKMGKPKENGIRPDVTRDDGSNILTLKQSYLTTYSNMNEDQIAEMVMLEQDEGATIEAFDTALPLSDFVKFGYETKEDQGLDLEALYGSDENFGAIHNKTIKEAKVWLEDYNTRKITPHQRNTCKKWFRVDINSELSYYQVEKLMKTAFWEVKQYKKAKSQDKNKDMIEALEKIEIIKTKLKTGQMFVGESSEDKEFYQKNYDPITYDKLIQDELKEKTDYTFYQ